MKNIKAVIYSICLTAFCSIVVSAQTTNQPSPEDLQKRIVQMESEMTQMREELTKLKESLIVNQSKAQNPASSLANASDSPSIAKVETKTETQINNKNATADKQTTLRGVDIGSARLTPYGTIYFNAFGDSGGTNNADVPLFATPSGSGNVSASARQSRLGLRLEGAKVGNARLTAILEADFSGGIPNIGIGENFGVIRLRLANARLDWEKTSVIVGQDWMVFAPNNPVSLAATAIPQLTASGNVWARIPQIKIERKLNENLAWAGAILAPQTGDYPVASNFFLQPTSGAASRVPFFQSRIAYVNKNFFGVKKNGSVGLSAHYGRSRIFTGTRNVKTDVDSVGLALDWNFPLSEYFTLAGEAFIGRNLGGFQAGVFQSINPDFAFNQNNNLISGGPRAIGTRGGWTQLGFTPPVLNDRFSILGSIGLDDPRDEDLTSLTRRDFRTRNLVYAFDLIYRFTPQFQVGAEFRRFQTNYFVSGRQNANHVNLGAAYSF